MGTLKKYRDLLVGICVGVVVAACLPKVLADTLQLSQIVPFRAEDLLLLKQARVLIEAYQVDAKEQEVPEEELVYGALRGMIAAWDDPYTRFVTPQELEEEQITYQGQYGGLGMTIGQRDGKILVISPMEDSPADRAGLRPMDQIVQVNDEVVLGWDMDRILKLLRGEPGNAVTVWVRREDESELLEFPMVREVIKLKSVRSEMLEGLIGYIRLSHFIVPSGPEVGNAVIDLKNQGARGLILDLRNNSGGLLESAVDVCDLFIDGGPLVYTRGRVDRANDEIYAQEGALTDLPLVVLINEGSASASEIVAGAVRDRHRGILIGQKSFGKGSVQTRFNLSDGSALYVTIARYFIPSGDTIDHVGLTPDIAVEGAWTKEIDEDPQVQTALAVLMRMFSGEAWADLVASYAVETPQLDQSLEAEVQKEESQENQGVRRP